MINFSDTENTTNLINLEKSSLQATLDIQKTLNKQILMFMKNFIGNIEIPTDFDPTNNFFHYINESTSALNKSNFNIDCIKKLISSLETLLLSKKNLSFEELEQLTNQYNDDFTKNIDIIYENTKFIENFIHSISLINMSEILKEFNNLTTENNSTSSDIENDIIFSGELNTSFIENTLIISEIQGKVILPYKINRIREILLNNSDKYNSMEDVIDKLYTKPITNYKHSSISRFKEAYKLITEKENSSKFKALSLASELFLNYNLHPAIITACNSLDELDIYLACLEDNSFEDFHFFDVKYEVAPVAIKAHSIIKN